MSSKVVKVFGLIVLVIGVFIGAYILMDNLKFKNKLYIDKVKNTSGIILNYPKFKQKNINKEIKTYLNKLNNKYDVTYKVNSIDNYISILFTKSLNKQIVDYDSYLFNLDGNEVNLSYILSDETYLKEKINIYLDINNITINKDAITKYNYFLNNQDLEVVITSVENDVKSFDIANINYHEIADILNIKYDVDENYIKILTTTTTTTTTTKATTKANTPKSDNGNKIIAFTFDDGPSAYTKDIMDILDEYGAKATFFEVGYMIKNRKSMVLEVLNRGFEIGNHTTDHSNLNTLSVEKIHEKVDGNNETFKEITGQDFPLLRPPYGNCKSSVKEQINVPIIKWSVDSRDWESRNKDKIVTLVKNNTSSGDIVLFHDLYKSTVDAIRELVPYYYEKGYQIVSVSKLFELNGLSLEPSHIYYSAKS